MSCGNHGCWIQDGPGMRTNSTCKCLDSLPLEDRRTIQNKFLNARRLYDAINHFFAIMGANGRVSTGDDETVALMDVLHSIDGGEYNKFIF